MCEFPGADPATGLQASKALRPEFKVDRHALIYDLNEHPEFSTSQRDLNDGFKSLIVLPLISKDWVIGILAVFSNQIHGFGPRERGILERLANQSAPAVENAWLYAQLRSTAAEMATVDEVARMVTSTLGQTSTKFTHFLPPN